MTILYGIRNCDTVKKARRWLDEHAIAYRFHDFRADGLDKRRLAHWTEQLGWEALLNRGGTTWRQLPSLQRDKVEDADSALAVMLAHASLIKRPVLERCDVLRVGFSAAEYTILLNKK